MNKIRIGTPIRKYKPVTVDPRHVQDEVDAIDRMGRKKATAKLITESTHVLTPEMIEEFHLIMRSGDFNI